MNTRNMIVGFALLLFCSCRCKPSKVQKSGLRPKSRVMVVCDASASVLQASHGSNYYPRQLDSLKAYIAAIPQWYKFGSEILYYPLSDQENAAQLGNTICYNITTNSKVEAETTRVNKEIVSIQKSMDDLMKQTQNSCLLKSIQRAAIKLTELARTNSGEKMPNELIIISDMLEDCTTNGKPVKLSYKAGPTDSEEASLQAAMSQISEIGDLNLSVIIIINAPGITEGLNQIKVIWRNWFDMIGIHGNQLQFYTSAPQFRRHKIFTDQ